ncbi:MAG TPA: TonB-dependent receptor [Azonexus sp.]|nr:TonB-dependent receptor [Azonexus sp.]
MNPRLTPLAAALSIAFLAPAQAQTADLDTVIVSATRFSETDTNVAANVSVITRDDIRNTPARDLPSMLKGSAGVDVRALYGSLGIDSTVDIRGFGETAGSNTLILLDGQRLNPIDMGSVSWSAIPLDSVQRIEIMRGAGTVLYGDKATGGVVNIITDKSGAPRAGATVGIGSYDTQTVDLNGAFGNEIGYANAFARYAHTGGWRENSQAEQAALSGRGGLYIGKGEAFVDYAVYNDHSGLPGYLLSAAYQNNPKTSTSPNDSQRSDGYRLRPGIALPISDTLRFEAEVSYDRQNQHANYVSFGSQADRTRDNWSITPRLRWQHGLGGLKSETVAGIDYYSGEVDATYTTSATQGAKQDSTGFYFQNITEWVAGLATTLGARSQRVDQSATQDAYMGFFGMQPAMSGSAEYTRSAWDLGLSYAGDGWRVYGKGGTTFRFANTDELFGYDPFTGNPTFAGNLKPQTGTLGEIGGSVTLGPVKGRAALYRMNLEDEIAYDGSLFANVNLDKTRRQGLELEADWRIVPSVLARATYTYTDSVFREGVYDGKQVPLVPHNKASARLTWDGAAIGKYTAVVNYVGERYYSGDFANALDKLPGYTTVDFMAGWNFKPWSISARLLNAFDKKYSPYAGYSTFQSDYYYYPADGRTFLMTASYNFR